jgi:hypothetical protein
LEKDRKHMNPEKTGNLQDFHLSKYGSEFFNERLIHIWISASENVGPEVAYLVRQLKNRKLTLLNKYEHKHVFDHC